jgi:hypothetical protein
MTQEALSSLQALGDQLRIQLLELPEYRALTVIDRTILELSEILRPSLNASANQPEQKTTAKESSSGLSAAVSSLQQRARTGPLAAGNSQNRMATAIAETIAAKATPLEAPTAASLQLDRVFSAAS